MSANLLWDELLRIVRKLVQDTLKEWRPDLTQTTGTLPPTQLPPAGGTGGSGSPGGVVLSDDDPEDTTSGAADPGTSSAVSRADHVHHSDGGSGALSDGDYGDIVVSGSGTVLSLDSSVVTAAAKTVLDDTTIGAMRATLGLAIGTDIQAYDAELAALAALVSAADKLPYFTGLGTAALADLTSFIRTLLDDANAAAARTTLGLGTAAVVDTGTGAANVPTITQADARYQPLDSDLTALAALTTTSYGRSLLEAADAAALRILAGLVIGTNVQAYDAELAALAGLTSAADKLPYFTGSGTAAVTDLTSFIRTLLDDADAAAARATIGAAADSHDHTGSTDGGKLTNDVHDGYSVFEEISAPSTPAANSVRLYAKDKGGTSILYFKDDAGTEYDLSIVGSSAPTGAEYVTTAATGSLSAEVAIPGLAGSADRAGIAGGGISEEYDTSTTGLTWSTSPTVEDSDTTFPSHLYVKLAVVNADYFGTQSWSPSGAFDIRAKLGVGNDLTGVGHFGLHIQDSGNTNRVEIRLNSSTAQVQAYTYASSTYTQRGNSWAYGAMNMLYVRITRNASNSVSFWWSGNGMVWQLIATQSFTFTVAKVGYRILTTGGHGASAAMYGVVDWLRSDV